eukprot:CAMPEP_0172707500 /NCGR_PEP_ID=MMETSP1074-20121228/49983_1 /TAXON_ID=2916 /ORGANISM="Ceratium fusus, Strain PA161109" /LENGTH=48 /DNA_ID= /DNA_START= /DNA_END= /DNA_ORIENTATION=
MAMAQLEEIVHDTTRAKALFAQKPPLSRVSAEFIELEKNDPLLCDNPQ